jgi:ribosome maturation factor RimP
MERNRKEKIQELATGVAAELGVELLNVGLFRRGMRHLLRATIDKEGGVSLEDCEGFSRRFGVLLDVEDPLPGSYTLEVTSPGLDRPLKSPKDFQKQKGKLVRIVTKEKVGNQSFFVGRLKETHDEGITLILVRKKNATEEINIPYVMISKANLEFDIQ